MCNQCTFNNVAPELMHNYMLEALLTCHVTQEKQPTSMAELLYCHLQFFLLHPTTFFFFNFKKRLQTKIQTTLPVSTNCFFYLLYEFVCLLLFFYFNFSLLYAGFTVSKTFQRFLKGGNETFQFESFLSCPQTLEGSLFVF